jgi:hypothetical protein
MSGLLMSGDFRMSQSYDENKVYQAITALRKALEQEPVVWMYQDKSTHDVLFQKHMRAFVDHSKTYETPLYTHPQPKQRPLTEWQPIKTAPKDGTDVIVMYQHIDTQIVHNAFWMGDSDDDPEDIGWWSYEYSEGSRIKLEDWMEPTHWMPLPAPPAHE